MAREGPRSFFKQGMGGWRDQVLTIGDNRIAIHLRAAAPGKRQCVEWHATTYLEAVDDSVTASVAAASRYKVTTSTAFAPSSVRQGTFAPLLGEALLRGRTPRK